MKNDNSKKPVTAQKETQPQKQGVQGTPTTPDPRKLVVKKPEAKTVTLTQLAAGYARKKLAYDKMRSALEKRLESLKKGIERFQNTAAQVEAKIASMVPPNGNTALIIPLAKELLGLFPGFNYEVSAPMGLSEAVTVTFFPKEATSDDRLSGKGCKSLTLITKMPQGGIGVRDYSKNTNAYAPGSLGYSSGLNHPTIPVPDNATVQWFAQWVK